MNKLLIINKTSINLLLRRSNLSIDSNMMISGNKENIDKFKSLLTPNIGIFYTDLPHHIINILMLNKKKIILAESCTGGLISYKLSTISGASNVFLGSYVSYSNDMKIKMLGIGKDKLQKYTPYSKQVVKSMLDGAIGNTQADFAIATSCIADSSNINMRGNNTGTSYIGIKQSLSKEKIYKLLFYGNRIDIQKQVATKALELLFKLLIRL